MKTHQKTRLNNAKNLFALIVFMLSMPSFAFQDEQNASGDTQGYISDDLYIYMHAGAGTNYRIVGTINAGSHIKLTGLSEDDYSQIIDDKNKTAWVETKYITEQPGLRFVVAELNAQLAEATDLNAQLDSQLNNVKETVSQLNDNSSQLNNEIATLKNQLASTQMKLKTQDTDVQKQWFFTGAIVLGVGLVLGLILPKLGGRRRGNMDSWS